MSILLVAYTFSAFENTCTINTFLNIFFWDNHRAHDIYNFYTKNKISQTINYKMSLKEKEAFNEFIEKMMQLDGYSKMCDFVTEFSSQLKTA